MTTGTELTWKALWIALPHRRPDSLHCCNNFFRGLFPWFAWPQFLQLVFQTSELPAVKD